MYMNFESIKFNFDLFTITYKECGTYTGLLKPTIHSQYKRVDFIRPLLDRLDRRKYESLIKMNSIMKKIVTQYEYDPSNGISDESLLFKPEAMPEEYLISALRTVFLSSSESEINRIKSAAGEMRGIITAKARERWGEFVGPKEAEFKIINEKKFQHSVSDYVDDGFSHSDVVSGNFTNFRELTQLPQKDLYRRSDGMRVEVVHDEWHEIMKSL